MSDLRPWQSSRACQGRFPSRERVEEQNMLDRNASRGTRWDEITLIGVALVVLSSLMLA
jgi:hypothetical protein